MKWRQTFRDRFFTLLFPVIFLLILPIACAAQGKIVFVGDTGICVINPDGTNQTCLTDGISNDKEPAFSRDGGKIVFVSDRTGNPEIYTMNADGTNQTRLTYNGGNFNYNEAYPSFSPDGGKIVFSAAPINGYFDIYVMNANGTNQINLTNTVGLSEFPVFSPGANKIAFSFNKQIYVMNADGTNRTALTNVPNARSLAPSFSPDGSNIVFQMSPPDNGFDIYVINADGANQTRLTYLASQKTFATKPVFSPDGNKIAFTNFNLDLQINVMNADGTGITPLVAGYDASWSGQTTTAAPKLKIAGGNLLVGSPGQGIILKSPDGATCKLLSIDNAGAMVLAAVACP